MADIGIRREGERNTSVKGVSEAWEDTDSISERMEGRDRQLPEGCRKSGGFPSPPDRQFGWEETRRDMIMFATWILH